MKTSDQLCWVAKRYSGRGFQRILGASRYLISNRGELISLINKTPRHLKNGLAGYGYLSNQLLFDDGVSRHRYIHQLVASEFIGMRPDGMVVRHLDGNCLNNNLNNIAYGTNADNEADKIRHGRRHPTNAKLTIKEVEEIRVLSLTGLSQSDIARKYNMSNMAINRIIRRESWK